MSTKSNSTPNCSRCGATEEMKFSLTQEPVCKKCFNAEGVCNSCSKKVGEKKLVISAGRKLCKKCNKHWDNAVFNAFG